MISLSEFRRLAGPVKLYPYQEELIKRIERGDRIVLGPHGFVWIQEGIFMNTDTGQLYEGLPAIHAAERRGEPLALLGPKAARVVRAGQAALRREERRTKRKGKREMAQASRRRNR